MDSSQTPEGLDERIAACLNLLRELKQRAENAYRTHRTASSANLLAKVKQNATDCSDSLQNWKNEFTRATVATNQELVNTTLGLLENLHHWIETAQDALDSRLRRRKLYGIGFFSSKRNHFEKRLERALKNVEQTIGKLKGQSKVLLEDRTRTAADRQSRVLGVHQDINQPYNDFSEFFGNLKNEEKENIRSSALKKFWEHFDQWRHLLPEIGDKIGNTADPGDGLMYKLEHINRASALLKDLHQAWLNMEDCASYPPPPQLPRMGRICLILMGMGQKTLLEDFLDGDICDDHLHLTKERLQEIFQNGHRDYVGTFLSEQYRAKPRPWILGQHVEMEDEEPLPLKRVDFYNLGSYGEVTKVQDSSTGNEYALKKQITRSTNKKARAQQQHLKDETKRLKGLQHKHVIRLVKTYERADAYGMVLDPAATSSLIGCTNRFRKNKFSTQEGCHDQEWLRPILLTAFGCLSQGLAYIHGKEIRHKDIKPANILFDKAKTKEDEANFIWADFGLAYDFSDTGESKTESEGIYSKRYAAPEILMASRNPARSQRSQSLAELDSIAEKTEGTRKTEETRNIVAGESGEKLFSDYKEGEDTKHGRKTDVFSLGCVFLEILAVLVHDILPMDRAAWNSAGEPVTNNQHLLPEAGRVGPIAKDDDMFCKHLKALRDWAEPHSSTDSNNDNNETDARSNAALAPLFRLAVKMVSNKAADRPLIDEVVREVATTGKQHFCTTCQAELPSIDQKKAFSQSSTASTVPANGTINARHDRRRSVASPETVGSPNRPNSLVRRSTAFMFGGESHGPGNPLMKMMSR